jgi:hypothetical protein
MVSESRELCPNCIDLTKIEEVIESIREDDKCVVERIIRYCSSCHQELADTVKLKFKPSMG